MKVSLNRRILDRNEQCAAQNRAFFAERGVLCVNVISSPGSGKTTLLSRTVADLGAQLRMGVIEGDIKTDTDARKIRAAGARAVQIETEGACHLSAVQVAEALRALDAADLDVVFIENVGNLVCPSAFDLGEDLRVVVLSVPEGDDKPIKYPGTFAGADIVLVNKVDLLEHVAFDLDRVRTDVHKVNPDAPILAVSALKGTGMTDWYDWLHGRKASRQASPNRLESHEGKTNHGD
ncbi:MAG TPA: hydrogenase accessory protein HypB [Phycisphaerales bacterium]|nr:hydrogenase accessory protein HypB [Phycisphaerales bacterium]